MMIKLLQPVTRRRDTHGTDQSDQVVGYSHQCPGCNHLHVYYIEVFNTPPNPIWKFNGNFEKPTFSPSLISKYTAGDPPKTYVCHYNMDDGMIKFHGDSNHALVNQTVPLPPHPDQDDY